jgi:hypothetical protein
MNATVRESESPNKPAAPNAVIASQLTTGYPWPGLGEPERSLTYGI